MNGISVNTVGKIVAVQADNGEEEMEYSWLQ